MAQDFHNPNSLLASSDIMTAILRLWPLYLSRLIFKIVDVKKGWYTPSDEF